MYQHNIIKYKFYENITRRVKSLCYLSNIIIFISFWKNIFFYFVNVFASFAHSMDVHISPHHPSIYDVQTYFLVKISFSLFFFYKKAWTESQKINNIIWKEARNKWKLLIKQDCESQCIHNLIRNTRYDSQSKQSNYFSSLFYFLFIAKSFAYCLVWIYFFYIFVCFIPQAWHVSGRLWITIVVFCRFCTRHYWLENGDELLIVQKKGGPEENFWKESRL